MIVVPDLVAEHEALGRMIEIGSNNTNGQRVFVREQGPTNGEVVLMIHGVPSSSFLYRKMFHPLAQRGYRAISFDFPGMGLSDKPNMNVNDESLYTWAGLKDSIKLVVEALELCDITLLVHDIGGPIACWYAIENKDKVKRIMFLNTLLKVHNFRKPFPMFLFPIPLVGRVVMATMTPRLFQIIMHQISIVDNKQFTYEDAKAWLYLLRSNGGSNSFLRIMKGFETTKELQETIKEGLQEGLHLGLIWGSQEKSIPKAQLAYIEDSLPIQFNERVDGAHFLQVDCAEDIVTHVDAFMTGATKAATATATSTIKM